MKLNTNSNSYIIIYSAILVVIVVRFSWLSWPSCWHLSIRH